MNNKTAMNINRRKWKRYVLKPGIVLSVQKENGRLMGLLKSSQVTWGPVENISMEGLCVQYIGGEKNLADFKRAVLTLGYDDAQVEGIDFKVVYDATVHAFQSGITVKKAGIRFLHPSLETKTRLESLINRYATETLADKRADKPKTEKPEVIYDRAGTRIVPIMLEDENERSPSRVLNKPHRSDSSV